MKQEIRIRQRTLGAAHPVFISAEVGVTCNYDMKITKELIDVVAETGADSVKFIFWFPEEIMADKAVEYEYATEEGRKRENMFEMLQGLRFDLDQWREIKAYADARGVIVFATVNSPTGIEWAETIGLEAYKLSSWDFNYHGLWRRIAALGKPMLIDTGPVNTLDVAKVMQILKDERNEQSLLVHCFHTDTHAEMNMRAIPYMARAFNTLVGFSATGRESEIDIMAVTLGSVYLEKRLTMSRRLPGHHQILSLEPKEFGDYVRLMRDVQAALGTEDLLPSATDLSERRKWFRRLVANRDLSRGTRLTADMVEAKRGETGVSPEYLQFFLGRPLTRDLRYNDDLTWDAV